MSDTSRRPGRTQHGATLAPSRATCRAPGPRTISAARFRKERPDLAAGGWHDVKRTPWVRRSPAEDRTVGSVTFASKAEATRYVQLLQLEAAGQVLYVLLQPTFLVLGVKVRADFQVFWADGRVTYEDAKARGGHPEHWRRFERNRRQVREAYGVEIEEVVP